MRFNRRALRGGTAGPTRCRALSRKEQLVGNNDAKPREIV